MTCTHPPVRLFSWHAHDGTLCIACCDCGDVLAGAAQPWSQITEDPEKTSSPADLIFEATTADGHVLGSSCLNGYGPRAYAMDNKGNGWDTTAFCGHDKHDAITKGKPHAVRLLQELIAYERRQTQ